MLPADNLGTGKIMKKTRNLKIAALILAANLSALGAWAQSADALIDKLVEKGILTVKEANDLREDTDKNFSQAYSVKSGMPEWVSALKFNGDFRGRFEQNNADNPAYFTRNRFRYRVQIGRASCRERV